MSKEKCCESVEFAKEIAPKDTSSTDNKGKDNKNNKPKNNSCGCS
ncbi:MAG TPA: hypothetical protein VGL27_12185 [Negativicutes bacterium]|jgi:hypothetical protein